MDLRIYDVSGRLVRVLRDGTFAPGRYTAEWDGLDRSGSRTAPGVYFSVFRTDGFTASKRLVRVR